MKIHVVYKGLLTLLLLFNLFCITAFSAQKPAITVGSKIFTESYILAEIVAEVIESTGEATVNRKFGMGATGILAEAIRTGAIDIYPEYSGTISEVILKKPALKNLGSIQKELQRMRLTTSDSLGFNNTYGIGLREEISSQLGIQSISDLRKVPHLKLGFSYEFMNRPDGYPALIRTYGLSPKSVHTMEHSLAYEALARKEIDGSDIYSTDAKIDKLHLNVLTDDQEFFPEYDAVLLVRSDFIERFPKIWQALQHRLEGRISEKEMRKMNAKADLEKKSFPEIAEKYLALSTTESIPLKKPYFSMEEFLLRTRQHLMLVIVSLAAAVLIGIALGILASRRRLLGNFILAASGILQTIPSLALLCFLIPVFGVGNPPALVALFLYALLPIVANTFLGLITIETPVLESAKALGLTRLEQLRMIELPLASPNILSGIRTSAIIGIGTATLAALIGAGGYGVPIVSGLALNDISIILTGAIPAAVLALCTHFAFNLLNRWIVPKGIQARNLRP